MKQNPGGTNLRFSMLHDQISQSWPTEEWRERAQVWFSSQVMAPTWMDRKLRRWKSSVGHWDTHTSGKLSKHITLREKPDAEHDIKSSFKTKAKHSQSKASCRTARGTNEINELGGNPSSNWYRIKNREIWSANKNQVTNKYSCVVF